MEHRRGELAYKAVLDKRVCPGCGAEQSYDEASSSTQRETNPPIVVLRPAYLVAWSLMLLVPFLFAPRTGNVMFRIGS